MACSRKYVSLTDNPRWLPFMHLNNNSNIKDVAIMKVLQFKDWELDLPAPGYANVLTFYNIAVTHTNNGNTMVQTT